MMDSAVLIYSSVYVSDNRLIDIVLSICVAYDIRSNMLRDNESHEKVRGSNSRNHWTSALCTFVEFAVLHFYAVRNRPPGASIR